MAGEVLQNELLHQLDTQIRVVARLDFMANTYDRVSIEVFCFACTLLTWDELILLPHGVHKFAWRHATVEGTGELLRCAVKGTPKARTNGQETRNKSTDQVFTSTSRDDSVHSSRDSWTVIGCEHPARPLATDILVKQSLY